MSDITVTIAHVRAANMCARGARNWFKQYNLDFALFLKQGYPIEVIENTDALGRRVAAVARQMAGEQK